MIVAGGETTATCGQNADGKRGRCFRPGRPPRRAQQPSADAGLSTSVKNPHPGGISGGVGAQQSIARTCSGGESRQPGDPLPRHSHRLPRPKVPVQVSPVELDGRAGEASEERWAVPEGGCYLFGCSSFRLFVINALRRHDVRAKTGHLETFNCLTQSPEWADEHV